MMMKTTPYTLNKIISKASSTLIVVLALWSTVAWSHTVVSDAVVPSVGDQAPDFSLNSLDGVPVKLSKELKNGPVILIMLRGWPGYQCPFCTRQVGDFLAHAKEIEATGASVILVYPGSADKLKEHAEEFRGNKDIPGNFKLLIDPDYVFTRAYGLRWDAQGETSYPSTFVIDKSSTIRYALVSKAHGGRPAAVDVIKVVSALGK